MASAPAANATTSTNTGPGICPKDGLLNFSSELTNGQVKLGKSATVSGSTGRACGVQILNDKDQLISRVKPANTSFAAVETKLGPLSLPTTLKVTSVLQGPAGFGPGGGLTAVLAGNVTATANIFGSKCDIPLKLRLTTGKSGALTGKEFIAVNGVQTGALVDNRFEVPKIQPSATCNVVIAGLSNTLLGLPLAAGESAITYDATLAFTQ